MKRKTRIRIWIVVIIIWLMWFSDWSFAAETEAEGLKILWMGLNYLVSVLGWIWVFFAKLAGTFLTNKWVYGEILWLDALLWKYWNVMKNIANFWLWFYFVYVIFRWLINQWKEDITKKLKDIILWLLIAWIWIQASWFFVATVLDVSTITLAAAGSFPSQVLSQSPYAEDAMRTSLSAYLNSNGEVGQGKKVSLFPKDQDASSLLETKMVSLVNIESFTGLVDTLMPNADDVSWPLYFIWFTILNTDVITSIDSSSGNWIKWTILNTIIQWWTTVVFAIEMLVLCVLALIRIIYLWMFIVLSPVAVLIWCIEKSWEKLWNWDWFFSKFTNQISFKTFFINVFKPTIIVLWFWVAIIFVALMNKVVLDYVDRCFDVKWMIVCSNKEPQSNANWNEWDQTYWVTFDNEFLHFTLAHSWRTLLALVLSVLTVLMVYLIIDFAVKMWNGKDFVSKSIGRVQDWLNTLIKSAPVIPVPAYDEYWKMKKWGALSISWLETLSRDWSRALTAGLDKKVSEQTDRVLEMWKIWDGSLWAAQKNRIRDAWENSTFKWLKILEEKRKEINLIKTDEWLWMTLASNAGDNGFWKTEFTKWLNRVKPADILDLEWKDIVTEWQREPDVNNRDFKKVFNNSKRATKYANFFGYTWSYANFDAIRNLDVSKK